MSQKTVDEIIASLPRSEQVIVKRLRALVIECLPKAEEKSYYDMGVPFYGSASKVGEEFFLNKSKISKKQLSQH